MNCWLCGRNAPSGVCSGPHAYELRSREGATSRNVELPVWWSVRGQPSDVTVDGPDEHRGVTSRGVDWRIRYDPAERLRRQVEAEAAARRVTEEMSERAAELELLLHLARKHGYALRPLAINVPAIGKAIH
jgi:hypothetical protein